MAAHCDILATQALLLVDHPTSAKQMAHTIFSLQQCMFRARVLVSRQPKSIDHLDSWTTCSSLTHQFVLIYKCTSLAATLHQSISKLSITPS